MHSEASEPSKDPHIQTARAIALAHLAASLAQAGHDLDAQPIWTEAKRVITSIMDENAQAKAQLALARTLARDHHWQEAELVAFSIGPAATRTKAGEDLVALLARAHHWHEAERIALSLERVSARAVALRILTTRLAQAHQWQEAERIALSIPPTLDQV